MGLNEGCTVYYKTILVKKLSKHKEADKIIVQYPK